MKVRIGRLAADLDEVMAGIDDADFQLLPITPLHLSALRSLPTHHRDPFDHLLIAQAVSEEAAFVSADGRVPSYPVRHLPCSTSPVPMQP